MPIGVISKGLASALPASRWGGQSKVTPENQATLKRGQAKRREEYLQRIPIEGKFAQGENGSRLNYIRAKRADTSVAWINSIFLVMNLLVLLKIFFALGKTGLAAMMWPLLQLEKSLHFHQQLRLVTVASRCRHPAGF